MGTRIHEWRAAGLFVPSRPDLWMAQILTRRIRKALLSDLAALEPVIATLGGAEAVAETCRAIQDVGRWWP